MVALLSWQKRTNEQTVVLQAASELLEYSDRQQVDVFKFSRQGLRALPEKSDRPAPGAAALQLHTASTESQGGRFAGTPLQFTFRRIPSSPTHSVRFHREESGR